MAESVGLDQLFTATICGVFIFTLWKLRNARKAKKQEKGKEEQREMTIRNHSFLSLHDCLGGDINYLPIERSSTPHSVISSSSDNSYVNVSETEEAWFADGGDTFSEQEQLLIRSYQSLPTVDEIFTDEDDENDSELDSDASSCN